MVNKFKTTNADKNKDGKIDLQEWNDFFNKEFYQPFDPKSNINAVATVLGYGNTGCGVFKWGVQNQKGFCLRINILKGIVEF